MKEETKQLTCFLCPDPACFVHKTASRLLVREVFSNLYASQFHTCYPLVCCAMLRGLCVGLCLVHTNHWSRCISCAKIRLRAHVEFRALIGCSRFWERSSRWSGLKIIWRSRLSSSPHRFSSREGFKVGVLPLSFKTPHILCAITALRVQYKG